MFRRNHLHVFWGRYVCAPCSVYPFVKRLVHTCSCTPTCLALEPVRTQPGKPSGAPSHKSVGLQSPVALRHLVLWVLRRASDGGLSILYLESNCPLPSSLVPDFTLWWCSDLLCLYYVPNISCLIHHLSGLYIASVTHHTSQVALSDQQLSFLSDARKCCQLENPSRPLGYDIT